MIVVGAGVVGTTAAWYLQAAGHEVTVIERREAAGLETSFANGGQISVSHAEPWAGPGVPRKALSWLGREDAPLLLRLGAGPALWGWGLRFLRECTAVRFRRNVEQLVRLGVHSRECLRQLRADLGLQYDQLTRGILHFYTDEKQFRASEIAAQLMRELGAARRAISVDEALALEPALAHVRSRLVGATFTDEDESGDAHRFTQQLARAAEARGALFLWNTEVTRFATIGDAIDGVRVRTTPGLHAPVAKMVSSERTLKADAFVLSAATASPRLARPLGLRLAIYPAKGYSATVPVLDPLGAPTVSLTDDERKIVFSRLGDRLRIAGTAELGARDLSLNDVRCRALVERSRELFGAACDWDRATFWAGFRPSTPSNLPYIGRARRWRNLFLDTGHGTLGWTHAAGSGQLLAERIGGRGTAIDLSAFERA